jgi:hypothetical protein
LILRRSRRAGGLTNALAGCVEIALLSLFPLVLAAGLFVWASGRVLHASTFARGITLVAVGYTGVIGVALFW